jgi:hypothetical protein
MTGKEIKNITTSVLAKLRDNSKSSGAPLQQVLQLYAMERERLTKHWKAGQGWVAM